MESVISKSDFIHALNMWMMRYTTNPEQFAREFESVMRFLSEVENGSTPSYGERSWAYVQWLLEHPDLTEPNPSL